MMVIKQQKILLLEEYNCFFFCMEEPTSVIVGSPACGRRVIA